MKKPPGIQWCGKSVHANCLARAAIIRRPLASDALAAVYKQLPPEARQQMLLSKRWNVWAVLADDDWSKDHGRADKAPTGREGVGE